MHRETKLIPSFFSIGFLIGDSMRAIRKQRKIKLEAKNMTLPRPKKMKALKKLNHLMKSLLNTIDEEREKLQTFTEHPFPTQWHITRLQTSLKKLTKQIDFVNKAINTIEKTRG